MMPSDYEDSLRRSAEDMAWVKQDVWHIDNARALNVRGALIKSFYRLYGRHGIKPNAFLVSCDLVRCLWEAGFISRGISTDRILFNGIPVYMTQDPDVMMAVIREEDN